MRKQQKRIKVPLCISIFFDFKQCSAPININQFLIILNRIFKVLLVATTGLPTWKIYGAYVLYFFCVYTDGIHYIVSGLE